MTHDETATWRVAPDAGVVISGDFFMFMLKRNRDLRDKLTAYLTTGVQTINCFRDGMHHYCSRGLDGMASYAKITHHDESECDLLRKTIEVELFEKSLMPEAREDIMMLLEHIDLVVNQAEDVLRQIVLQRIVLPADYIETYGELGSVCHEACTRLMEQGLSAMEGDMAGRDLGDRIDQLESASDKLEQNIIRRLFDSDLPLAEKMHYRDLVSATAQLCDLAEDAAGLITISRIKREI